MARHHTELVMEGGGAGGHTNHGCTAGAGPRDPGSGQLQHQTPASTGSCFYTLHTPDIYLLDTCPEHAGAVSLVTV